MQGEGGGAGGGGFTNLEHALKPAEMRTVATTEMRKGAREQRNCFRNMKKRSRREFLMGSRGNDDVRDGNDDDDGENDDGNDDDDDDDDGDDDDDDEEEEDMRKWMTQMVLMMVMSTVWQWR